MATFPTVASILSVSSTAEAPAAVTAARARSSWASDRTNSPISSDRYPSLRRAATHSATVAKHALALRRISLA